LTLDLIKNGPILFIGCHPDDIELGCGGLINKLKNQHKIYTLILSKNLDQPEHKNLVIESKKSLKILGVKERNIIFGDFKSREFSYQRQKIVDYLWQMKKKIKPTCVFITPFDLHQDHQVCNMESKRVFREKSILEYDLVRSTLDRNHSMFVELTKKELDVKIKALEQYKTHSKRNYFKKQTITSIAQAGGIKQELDFCEIFKPVSIIF
jgi:LmbE family N-acetylglucosaminyl deacetylase